MANPLRLNGKNLCDAALEVLHNLRVHLIARMNVEREKPGGTRRQTFRLLRTQLKSVIEFIRVGQLPFTPLRMLRLYQGCINNELQPIPYD
ncbi:hypothetical protein GCK72_025003 [Caenorhabditis remanei]|uniref:Uncharacterized protein n=1 Tax=Caenorhabditis remanei TaxID=31234 RepID=E3MRQ4_CAERE|nr:hypothetical protein GCK72_025003 [Caenorhabditis remanei]EFP08055.1 hypothetical protein CRE_14749 [Caenorhabditis remanei]KAF1748536.1 hypothetical protein GCK72_025003 [Caenorhabditis remanei]